MQVKNTKIGMKGDAESVNYFDQISNNRRLTVLLIFLFVLIFTAVIVVFLYLIGVILTNFGIFTGNTTYDFLIFGLEVAPGLIVLYGIYAYFEGDRYVLSREHAKPANRQTYKDFYDIIETLSAGMQLPFPKLYVKVSDEPNAFATGRNRKHASVCATTGLLKLMDKNELRGVLAHEMSHIANNDIQVMIVTTVFGRGLYFMGDFIAKASGNSVFGSSTADNNKFIAAIFAISAIILAYTLYTNNVNFSIPLVVAVIVTILLVPKVLKGIFFSFASLGSGLTAMLIMWLLVVFVALPILGTFVILALYDLPYGIMLAVGLFLSVGMIKASGYSWSKRSLMIMVIGLILIIFSCYVLLSNQAGRGEVAGIYSYLVLIIGALPGILGFIYQILLFIYGMASVPVPGFIYAFALALAFFMLLSPLFSMIIEPAVSRRREYMADANGARVTREPYNLASALKKIQEWERGVASKRGGLDNMRSIYFTDFDFGGFFAKLLASHPPIEERIRILENMH